MAVLFQPAQLPVTLLPSRGRLLTVMAGSAGFVAVGLWLRPSNPWFAWTCILFFGACGAVALLNMLPGAAYLRLDAEGFSFRSLFRQQRFLWTDTHSFTVIAVHRKRMVAWCYATGRGSGFASKFNQQLFACDAALPDTYGVNVDDLAETMDALCTLRHAAAGESLAALSFGKAITVQPAG